MRILAHCLHVTAAFISFVGAVIEQSQGSAVVRFGDVAYYMHDVSKVHIFYSILSFNVLQGVLAVLITLT